MRKQQTKNPDAFTCKQFSLPCSRISEKLEQGNLKIWGDLLEILGRFWRKISCQSERTYFNCIWIKSSRILLIFFTLRWIMSNIVELVHVRLNCFTSRWMVSHYFKSFHVTLNGFTLHWIISHRVEWFRITLNHFTLRWMVSHYVESFHIALNGFTTRRAETAQITSSQIMTNYFKMDWLISLHRLHV